MGGNDGIRGYLVQTIIGVLDSLETEDNWETITIEPNLGKEFEKVDIIKTFKDRPPLSTQVKSTRKVFSYADVNRWCEEINATVPDEHLKELILVGRIATKLFDVNELHDVQIPEPKNLDIDSMLDAGSTKIDRFYTRHNRDRINVNLRDMIFKSLVTDFTKNSITGVTLTKHELESNLLEWIAIIEDHLRNEPLLAITGIDNIEERVSFSHVLTSKILELIGWRQFGENEQVTWFDRDTGEEFERTVNFVGDFDNELKSGTHDNILIRAIDTPEYPDSPTKVMRQVYEESTPIQEKLEEANMFPIKKDKTTTSNNLTFWYSNGLEDEDRYYVTDLFDGEYGYTYMDSDSNYFFIDNAKANFLLSSIVTARLYRPELPVKFLYPITQSNMTEDKIGKRGLKLPVQYINSSVLPIIQEDSNRISVLLFCSDSYSPDALRKLIWLIINLTSGFGNEYIIYFPDFEASFENEARAIIRSFQDEVLTNKTSVKRIQTVNQKDITTLPIVAKDTVTSAVDESSTPRTQLKPIGTLFTDYLPYGDLLRPFLRTEQIQGKDLKIFLARRGVFFKNAGKKKLVDFIAQLLFSPSELDGFRMMIDIKEKSSKTNTEVDKIKEGTSIDEIHQKLPNINIETLTEGLTTEILGQPKYKLENNTIELEFYTQHKDPTDHLSINTSLGGVSISMKIVDNVLLTKAVRTSSKDDKLIANRILKKNWQKMNEEEIIIEETRDVKFSDFRDNIERVQFLLNFTDISSSLLFIDQEITNVKFKYDETQTDIPENLLDRTEKDLTIYFNGKNLEGLNEMSDDEFKKLILLEEMIIKYTFNWGNITNGLYSVKYNFSGALKASNRDGKFQSEPKLYNTYQVKNLSNKRGLEKTLSEEVERLKIEKLKAFGLL